MIICINEEVHSPQSFVQSTQRDLSAGDNVIREMLGFISSMIQRIPQESNPSESLLHLNNVGLCLNATNKIVLLR